MNAKERIERWYAPEQRDSDILLRTMINDVVKDGSRVLDVGAGLERSFPTD